MDREKKYEWIEGKYAPSVEEVLRMDLENVAVEDLPSFFYARNGEHLNPGLLAYSVFGREWFISETTAVEKGWPMKAPLDEIMQHVLAGVEPLNLKPMVLKTRNDESYIKEEEWSGRSPRGKKKQGRKAAKANPDYKTYDPKERIGMTQDDLQRVVNDVVHPSKYYMERHPLKTLEVSKLKSHKSHKFINGKPEREDVVMKIVPASLVCADCHNGNDVIEQRIGGIIVVAAEVDGKVKLAGCVTELMPHDRCLHIKWWDAFDMANGGGSGYSQESWPHKWMTKGTYDVLEKTLDEWTPSDPLPPGWQINHWKTQDPPDVRLYVNFPIRDKFFDELTVTADVGWMLIRKYLFWMQMTGTVDEYTKLQEMNRLPLSRREINSEWAPDKMWRRNSYLFCGFERPPGEMLLEEFVKRQGEGSHGIKHQPWHADFTNLEMVINGNSVDVPMHENPKLENLGKGVSVICLIQGKERTVLVKGGADGQDETIAATKDQMIVLEASKIHGGIINGWDSVGLNVGIHEESHSRHHPVDIGSFLFVDVEDLGGAGKVGGEGVAKVWELDEEGQVKRFGDLCVPVRAFVESLEGHWTEVSPALKCEMKKFAARIVSGLKGAEEQAVEDAMEVDKDGAFSKKRKAGGDNVVG